MSTVKRIALIVLDGLGAGAQADAAAYGDSGADTLRHVWETQKPDIPNLIELGLLTAAGIHTAEEDEPIGCYGLMRETSPGKDTTTGHWEMAGLPLEKPFPTYPNGFPEEVIKAFEDETGLTVIGNKPASGTEIIRELGVEHLRTGSLIVYTSADSVFQIAAHESVVQIQELYHICRIARRLLKGEHAVGRVIARPFTGEVGQFVRTANRRDFSVDPSGRTMLDAIRDAGLSTIGIGKIEDIFNNTGLSASDHAAGNEACVDSIVEQLKKPNWKGLLFANLVDTDSLYGHRRDAAGFAKCLEDFDRRLPEILRLLGEDGVLIITADHGCDPTYAAHTDHTREKVPVLAWGLNLDEGKQIPERESFADLSATILEALGVKEKLPGKSFWQDVAL